MYKRHADNKKELFNGICNSFLFLFIRFEVYFWVSPHVLNTSLIFMKCILSCRSKSPKRHPACLPVCEAVLESLRQRGKVELWVPVV